MPKISNIYRDIPELFKPELQKDEKILWSGRPEPRIFSARDIVQIPFSLLWGGFACFWEYTVIHAYLNSPSHKGAPLFMVLWGIPFVCIGLYMIVGRFFYQAWLQKNTFYAITSKRVLILVTGKNRSIQALFLDQLPAINKSVDKNGVGTLVFTDMPQILQLAGLQNNMTYRNAPRGQSVTTFANVKEANRVYAILLKQRGMIERAKDK